jgi:hypothetical protein
VLRSPLCPAATREADSAGSGAGAACFLARLLAGVTRDRRCLAGAVAASEAYGAPPSARPTGPSGSSPEGG